MHRRSPVRYVYTPDKIKYCRIYTEVSVYLDLNLETRWWIIYPKTPCKELKTFVGTWVDLYFPYYFNTPTLIYYRLLVDRTKDRLLIVFYHR